MVWLRAGGSVLRVGLEATNWLTGNAHRTGKLDLNVPPFVNLEFDTESRKLVLTIEDRKLKQQKEMWGALNFPQIHMSPEQAR